MGDGGGTSSVWKGWGHCLACPSRADGLFAAVPGNRLAEILHGIGTIEFAAGTFLFRCGEPAEAIYCLRSGLVVLEAGTSGGAVRLLRGGNITGLETTAGALHRHRARALIPTLACRIPGAALECLTAEVPGITKDLFRAWNDALAACETWLVRMVAGRAAARIARLLLFVHEHEPAARMLHRDDIAAVLGMAPETVARVCADFRRRGLIRTPGHRLVEIDAPALRAEAED